MKRIFAAVFVVALCANTLCYSAYSPELNITASKTIHTISPGLKYINSVELCENVRQEVFAFEFTPGMQTEIVAAYGQYIYGFNSVGSMISSYEGDGRIVGGINTDFFITSTGIPLSCLVAEDEIISSCDGRVAIGFDEYGNALIGNPEIKADIVSNDGSIKIPIAHINKTPAIWGAYLVTDKFNSTTKSSVESIEIVLRPVSYISENDAFTTEIADDLTNKPVSYTYSFPTEVNFQERASSGPLTNEYLPDDVGVDETISGENGVLQESNNNQISDERVILRAGRKIKTLVEDIRYNSKNSEIPEGCFVTCIPMENFSYLASGINKGDELIINTSCNSDFTDCVNIFGAGTMIIENGVKIEQENSSVFIYKQPRTAAGIKEDGTVLFVCVDGRNPGTSSGYTINELSDYLLSQGCVDAINFDGGGSTTFYAADIGELNPELKNTPSDGFERRVADGLIFVNNSPVNYQVSYAATYPSKFYIFNKGATIKVGENILFADSNYHPVTDFNFTYQLSVPEEFGQITDGYFFPTGKTGKASISLDNNAGINFNNVGEIIITDYVDNIIFKADDIFLSPFEQSSNLSLSASLNTIPVHVTPDSAEIHLYKKVDNLSEIQYIQAEESEIYIDKESFSVVPLKRDETYIVSLNLGGVLREIEIFAEKHPFDDMESHWAAMTSYDMFKNELFVGEISYDGSRMFYPERNMTRAEFCVVLSRLLGMNSNNYIVLGENTDSPETEISPSLDEKEYTLNDVPEWAKADVKALYDEGYLDELIVIGENNEPTIYAGDNITRMDVIRILGSVIAKDLEQSLGQTNNVINFYDFVPKKEFDSNYLQIVNDFGIIQGYEDGSIRQNAQLTRAEAATIFSRLFEKMKLFDLSE